MTTMKQKRGNKRTSTDGQVRNNKRIKGNANYLESTCNDASWYAESPQLLRDASSFPYGWAVGAGFDLTNAPDNDLQSVPGVCALRVRTTIGISEDNFSAANIAARNIYSYVRHANSGHSNYDAPDLMMYLIGMDSIYAMYSYLKRIYGVARLYTQVNRYYPRTILQSMGVDPDSVMNNLADLRYFINQYAIKIGSMCVPVSMSYFTRHMWMYDGLYVDDTSRKAQTYLFTPEGFYEFDEYSGPGKLIFTPIPDTLNPINDLIKIAQRMIDKVLSSEDMNIMSGDILKAYGESGVYKVAGVSEDYTVLPTYNEEVLSQIQNATILDGALIGNEPITQSATTGAIIYNPTMKKSSITDTNYWSVLYDLYAHDRFVNMYKDDVQPADTMVATRLMSIASKPQITPSDTGASSIVVGFEHLGSEIVTGVYYFKFAPGTSGFESVKYGIEGVVPVSTNTHDPAATYANLVQSINKIIRYARDLSNFRFHPAYSICRLSYGEDYVLSNVDYGKPVIDLNNYTIINEKDLGRMHETALLSEFSCPQMGAFDNKLS